MVAESATRTALALLPLGSAKSMTGRDQRSTNVPVAVWGLPHQQVNGRRNLRGTTWVRIVDGDCPNRRLIDRNDSHASNRSHSSVFSNSDDRRITHLHNETLHSRRRCCNDPLTSLPLWRLGRSGLVHATKQFSTSHRDPLTVMFAMGFLGGLNRSSTCMTVR